MKRPLYVKASRFLVRVQIVVKRFSQLKFTNPGRGYPKQDPYQVLGIDPSASEDDIKKVYYALAKQYHPDTNKDQKAHEKFAQIKEAYETLCNETASHHTETRSQRSREFNPNDMFGSGGEPMRPMTGEDIQVHLTISFLENVQGTTKPVMVERITHCTACQGSGMRAERHAPVAMGQAGNPCGWVNFMRRRGVRRVVARVQE
ncbi:hypothetical protein DFQ28_005245 [Apophysomyces sp. BC1034]|nr:hypothetical protein DFQ30_003413 [Apophysomyces sp. BC1015]KAG0182825.1 hypothetical protein DFQ29_001991 [Apophysomyces sp. BC1021]KAG0193428.1 hypothetical protein DFQ28_005245 [Apophysomyces sp. BC1034]